ncbi:hypothetical protein OIU77_018919 [Salix suchowensis]|uniref:Protein kinase domain-containing protein n=1 Tax=Salix suchowensis TaxID=1278906 RepID=A0ABQ9CE89_9ROSI|nr:hypothetical protein OIU77_018919 [Salix suchowensis]
MGEDANSWIRRTKFSHTIYHRLDPSRPASFPINIQSERFAGLKSRPGTASPKQKSQQPLSKQKSQQSLSNQNSQQSFPGQKSLSQKSLSNQNSQRSFPSQKSLSFPSQESLVSDNSQIRRNALTNKQRSLSPLPETNLSDTFKEARSDKKRFSTPHARRKNRDMGIIGKFLHKESRESKEKSNTSPLTHLTSMKGGHEKSRSKEYAWAKFAHGAHSRLYHGLYKDKPVAVKIIRVPDDDENGNLATRLENQFNREVLLLSQLHHPNVIKFVAACRKPPVYCVITEYLSEGSLRAYLHKLEHKALSFEKLMTIALDIARGMEYIHSQACGEAYYDLPADDPGTYRWMAPEMIKKKSYGRKVDVYSFGLILWEMVAGTIPYEDMTPIQAAFAVVNKNSRPVIPRDCPPAMGALIEQCWSLQSDKRPEFWQIVKVLEQFQSSLAHDGTLNLVQNLTFQDHKKRNAPLDSKARYSESQEHTRAQT